MLHGPTQIINPFARRAFGYGTGSSGAGAGASFPDDIAGLLWRLESDLITGTSNGATLQTWEDASSNNNDVTQATSARRPVYNATDADWNGKASLTFDGVDDSMSFGGALQPVSIFVGVKTTNTPSLGRYFSSATGDSSILDNYVTAFANTTRIRFGVSGADTFYDPMVFTPTLWEAFYNSGGDSYVAKNGTEANAGAKSAFESSTYTLGDYTDAGGQCFGGTMAFCIAFSTYLSLTDRARVRQYLNEVYFGGSL